MDTAIGRMVGHLMGLEVDVEYLKRILDKAMDEQDGKVKHLGMEEMQQFKAEVTALLKERYKDVLPVAPPSDDEEEALEDE